MLNPSSVYSWEIETSDGIITKQYNEDGTENTWKNLSVDLIIRISFIPNIVILPRHDLLFDIPKGDKFVKRFGRGFIKQGEDGLKLREYLNCVVTNKYRFYLFHTGKCLITHKDQEVYI